MTAARLSLGAVTAVTRRPLAMQNDTGYLAGYDSAIPACT